MALRRGSPERHHGAEPDRDLGLDLDVAYVVSGEVVVERDGEIVYGRTDPDLVRRQVLDERATPYVSSCCVF